MPAGTVGGRMAPVRMPAFLSAAANAIVVALSPVITGTIWLCDAPVSNPRACSNSRKKAALASKVRPSSGSRSSNLNAAMAAPQADGGGAVV